MDSSLGFKIPSQEVMKNFEDGFLKTRVWCVAGEDETIGIKGHDVWSPVVIDLREISFIKVNEDPDHFAFGKAVLYQKSGYGSITVDESYNDVVYMWMQTKNKK